MAARRKSVVRIGIYYDGYFFYKVSNFYKFDHQRQSRISISGFHDFICNEVALKLDEDIDNCKIVEAHYFRGRSTKPSNDKAIVGERYFEDALTREGVQFHYLPLVRGSNNELKEKGIDVSLALDAYKKAYAKTFDIFVLVAGDGDYLPLVRELQTMGTTLEVMLASWDFENTNGEMTITSQDLLEEVKYPLQMSNIIDDRLNIKNPVINGLFEPRQMEPRQNDAMYPTDQFAYNAQASMAGAPPPPPYAGMQYNNETPYWAKGDHPGPYAPRRKVLTEEEMAQERISTILSIDSAGGWLKDLEYNNFYFFASDVVNKKPEELEIGMTLQFRLRFDRVKTEQKDNGEPSYRAVGPILAVD